MSGQIVISYELKDAAPAFIRFMLIKTRWVFAHRNKRHVGNPRRYGVRMSSNIRIFE